MFFFEKYNYFINYILVNLDELLLVIFLFSFTKMILMCSLVELIWPTQFFNRRHSISFQTLHWRTYTEFFLKLRKKLLVKNYMNRYSMKIARKRFWY